jgi:hypothetical protein
MNPGGWEELLRDRPRFHRMPGGYVSWSSDRDVLEYIVTNTSKDSRSLEVGAGLSTVLFAISGAKHTVITPSQHEKDLISRFCEQRSINLRNVSFILGQSEHVLPRLKLSRVDIVLIDGSHKFPNPFLDWYYAAPILRTGGLLVLDDLYYWTVDTLYQFLLEEPEWVLVKRLERAAVFRKLKDSIHNKSSWDQPYHVQQSIKVARKLYLSNAVKSVILGQWKGAIRWIKKAQTVETGLFALPDRQTPFSGNANLRQKGSTGMGKSNKHW